MTSTEPTPQDSDDGTANTESAPEKKSRFEAAQDTFDTSQTFADLGLSDEVLRGIEASGFEHPTRIQAALIPAAIAGKHAYPQLRQE